LPGVESAIIMNPIYSPVPDYSMTNYPNILLNRPDRMDA
jgi:hypothetical protein